MSKILEDRNDFSENIRRFLRVYDNFCRSFQYNREKVEDMGKRLQFFLILGSEDEQILYTVCSFISSVHSKLDFNKISITVGTTQ